MPFGGNLSDGEKVGNNLRVNMGKPVNHVSCFMPHKNIPDLHQNAGHIKKGIDNSWMENVGTLMVYIIYLCLLLLYFRTLEYIDRQVCVCVCRMAISTILIHF